MDWYLIFVQNLHASSIVLDAGSSACKLSKQVIPTPLVVALIVAVDLISPPVIEINLTLKSPTVTSLSEFSLFW